MLSFRMGSGAEMVLWYIIPRRFSLSPPKRVTRYFSTFYRSPTLATHPTSKTNHSCCKSHVSRRHSHKASGSNGNKWTGWRYWFAIWKPLPLSVGLAVLAILQWRRIMRRNEKGGSSEVARAWEVTCYRAVPLRAMSRAWGWLTSTELPSYVRPWLYSRYANRFGVDLDECANDDLTSYASLAEFFVRELKDGARPIDPVDLVSPCDGRILSIGRVTKARVEQVKGVTYSLPTFLGEQTWTHLGGEISDYFKPEDSVVAPEVPIGGNDDYQQSLLQNEGTSLYQCVIYLAPGDYHRFHSPVTWNVAFRRHFQGELLSVNPRIAEWIPDLFSLNERAVYVGRWKHGFFSLTAVGATNVGSIHVYCDQALVTNQRKWRRSEPRHRDLALGDTKLNKGDAFGEFRLGSTVVLLFEAPKDFLLSAQPGSRARVGQKLGS